MNLVFFVHQCQMIYRRILTFQGLCTYYKKKKKKTFKKNFHEINNNNNNNRFR